MGQEWKATGFPVEYYALGGEGTGIPLRVTMSAFGPTLLSKVLGLNDTQESSLGLVFHYADKAGLPLLDLADLRAVVGYLTSDEGKPDLKELGGLSSATAGVILRELIAFQDQGAEAFFGEPEFESADLLQLAPDGRGLITLVELPNLQDRPAVFSTFLMWLLADLFHDLPEVGDIDKPKLVFFFDEAHLLFDDASKAFLDQIAQTVRLIRSKGVGVFFVTQSPTDVPDDVLAQLGSRVQHQLRAHTPNDAKALKATVNTYPTSAYADLGEVITSLGHRRGRRHRDERARRADPGGLDPAARAGVADGPGRPRRDAGGRRGEPAARQVRRVDRPRVGPREARRPARGGRPQAGRGGGRRGGRQGQAGEQAGAEPAYREEGRRRPGQRRGRAPAPSRTSCAPRPGRSPAACSGPAAAEPSDQAVQRTESSTRSASACTPRRSWRFDIRSVS